MKSYYLKDIDPELWRKVKTKAASMEKSVRDVILELLEKWLKSSK